MQFYAEEKKERGNQTVEIENDNAGRKVCDVWGFLDCVDLKEKTGRYHSSCSRWSGTPCYSTADGISTGLTPFILIF